MIKALLTLLLAGVVGFVLFRIRRSEEENRNEVESWIDEVLVGPLGRKTGKREEDVRRSLKGSPPDPGVVRAVDAVVRSVELEFSRERGQDVEIRLDLQYRDGTSFSARSEWDWDLLPEPVRGEFLRGGVKTVRRPWFFPWQAAEA